MLTKLKSLLCKKVPNRNTIITECLGSDIANKYDYHISGILEKVPANIIYCILPDTTLITYTDHEVKHFSISKQYTLFIRNDIIDITPLSNTLILLSLQNGSCEVYNITSLECICILPTEPGAKKCILLSDGRLLYMYFTNNAYALDIWSIHSKAQI